MEHYDNQLAQRVWQRVQNRQPGTPETELLSLLQAEIADLSRYQQLQSATSSAQKLLLQQLIRQTRQCISILRGIAFLLTEEIPEIKAFPLPKELPSASLRRLYGSVLQRLRLYEQWLDHPEYDPGFRQLRHLSEDRCALLLQLLGS